MFYDILKGKNAFLGYKNKKFLNFLLSIFPNGLVHGFGPKLVIFPPFFLGNIGQENVFYDIVEGKNASLGYKNRKFEKSKNWHFSKVHGFGPKLDIFPPFLFLGNIGQENFFLIF